MKLKSVIATSIAILLTVGSTAMVMAAIPDATGKVNACYSNITKTLSVTDPAGSCNVGSTAISWDQNGLNRIAYAQLNEDGSLNTSMTSSSVM